jgi:hypothetical protein
MGRGRQKAKQTKVARELKYFSQETDYDALAQELRGENPKETAVEETPYEEDLIAKYADWLQEEVPSTDR